MKKRTLGNSGLEVAPLALGGGVGVIPYFSLAPWNVIDFGVRIGSDTRWSHAGVSDFFPVSSRQFGESDLRVVTGNP